MINAIIFSKDRAMQLKLLLDSMTKNAPLMFHPTVIYKSSNEFYQQGYDKLEQEGHCDFIKEEDFKKQTLDLLVNKGMYTCFFTDDDIIYKPIEDIQTIERLFDAHIDLFCFSLRLGKNVTRCYTMQSDNVLKGECEVDDDFIMWDWSKHYLDFGYPLSVDGHIFRTKDILKLTKGISFQNPNTLEIAWQIYDNYPKNLMASYKESRLVNSPNNMVQNVIENVSSQEYEISTKDLNQMYLDGQIIDLESIDFKNIIGCHQELFLPIIKQKESNVSV